jgi:hypothetical protein
LNHVEDAKNLIKFNYKEIIKYSEIANKEILKIK